MRLGRAYIIPAIVALSVAGSALVGSAMPAAAAVCAPNAHLTVSGITPGTDMYHHG